jgi:hypothetical protein
VNRWPRSGTEPHTRQTDPSARQRLAHASSFLVLGIVGAHDVRKYSSACFRLRCARFGPPRECIVDENRRLHSLRIECQANRRSVSGQKSAWGKRRAVERRLSSKSREPRFWIVSGLPTNRELHDSHVTLRQEALAPVIVDTSEFEQSDDKPILHESLLALAPTISGAHSVHHRPHNRHHHSHHA